MIDFKVNVGLVSRAVAAADWPAGSMGDPSQPASKVGQKGRDSNSENEMMAVG